MKACKLKVLLKNTDKYSPASIRGLTVQPKVKVPFKKTAKRHADLRLSMVAKSDLPVDRWFRYPIIYRLSTIPNWWCRISLAHPQ